MLRMMKRLVLFAFALIELSAAYSASKDAQIIEQYRRLKQLNHAKIARNLVHYTNWAAVGTISTNSKIAGFPMVNIISTDDMDSNGVSTGKIHFLLTDLDFTGPDWRAANKVSFLYTEEQNKNCSKRGEDPMEPTCARAIFSGKVKELDKSSLDYPKEIDAFINRHPSAENWLKAHSFYLCELEIENIFVLDFYGGPHEVTNLQYYSTQPDAL